MIGVYIARFFAGLFFFNAFPHLFNGVSGRSFPTPFAKPPGKGLSSPIVNVVWALANLVIAYLLTARIGDFQFHAVDEMLCLLLGGLVISVQLAWHFGKNPKLSGS